MLTPLSILKMWKRVNDRYGLAEDDPKAKGKEKKPSAKAKQAEKEDNRIEKNLIGLRAMGKGDLSNPATAKKFIKSREKTAKSMKKYSKLLKTNDLKDAVQDLPKFRKAVKQLIVVVESLDVRAYPDEADGPGPDLSALDKVDTSALDKAMEDPNFGEYSDAELDSPEEEQEEQEEVQATKEEAPSTEGPPKPPDQGATKFTARLKGLMPSIQKGQAEKSPAADEAKLKVSEANVFARKQDFAQANALLDKVESLLKPAGPGADEAAEFTARLKALMPEIQKALALGTEAGNEAKLQVSEANTFARKRDFAQANALLDQVEARIKPSASTTPPEDLAAVFKQRVQAFRPSFNTALTQARATNPDLAEDLDGFFAQMFDEAKAKDFATALQTLDQLTALVAKSAPAPSGGDPAVEWKTKLAEWTPAIKAALTAKGPNAAAIAKLLAQATALSKPGGDTVQALAKLTECHALATAGAATPVQAAAARWNAARSVAVAKMQGEIKAVVASKDPEAGQAELELKAVLMQLNGKLETRQQAAEMERYLSQDDVVTAVCKLAFDLKSPLLEVLAEITPQLSA